MAKKKRYIVVPRTPGVMETGLKTGKGKLDFKGKTATWVSDPAEAKEIETQYGRKGSGDVWVAQDENLEWHEHHDGHTDGRKVSIHHYTFAGVDLQKRGGNKRVKVKTADGYTFMAEEVAIELGYEIVRDKHANASVLRSGKNRLAPKESSRLGRVPKAG